MSILDMLSEVPNRPPVPEEPQVGVSEANQIAYSLLAARNAARTALSAYSARGQLAAWRSAIPELPTDYVAAVDELALFTPQLIDELREGLASTLPHISRLNRAQPSKTAWSRPVDPEAQRGIWSGKRPWLKHAHDYLNQELSGPGHAISDSNLHALLETMLTLVNAFGHNLTASHETIAQLAIAEHGCTLAPTTAKQRVRTIRRLLEEGGLLITHRVGGHLTSLERLAARAHHGGNQNRCASTCDLNLPTHLRPPPPAPPKAPAYAQGLSERLAVRDRQNLKKSTYACGSGFPDPLGLRRVAHASAQAREQQVDSSKKMSSLSPSLRARKIADDLTRTGINSGAENGPYSHLVGEKRGQIRLGLVAQLIERFTPSWAETRHVMQGLAHAATSGSTGYIALGLGTRPKSAAAWLTAVLQGICWGQASEWPTWSVTARAFGVGWCGDRHKWRTTPLYPPTATTEAVGLPATSARRQGHLASIREILSRA